MSIDPYQALKALLYETAPLTGETFFRAAALHLSRILRADFVFVARLRQADSDEVEVIASCKEGQDMGAWSFRLPGTPCSLIYARNIYDEWDKVQAGQMVCVNELVYRRFEATRDTRYEVFVGAPLRDSKKNLIGHLALFFEQRWLSDAHRRHIVELVELFSYRVEVELNRMVLESERLQALADLEAANKRLLQETITDPLTQLYNRRHFSQRMQEAFNRYRRNRSGYALILIDVDYFKSINDEYGHEQGDMALQHVAAILRSNSRTDIELVFRVGGEEFAILCQGSLSLMIVQKLGARISQAFRSSKIPGLPDKVLTVSMGAAFPARQDSSWHAVYNRADSALY
ncbi:MAG: GGDEF domain-containing protein, partial [Pseudomonadota bacterium]|nr:GGDEF domain-containing protein [Pseudomonadota bacterium]